MLKSVKESRTDRNTGKTVKIMKRMKNGASIKYAVLFLLISFHVHCHFVISERCVGRLTSDLVVCDISLSFTMFAMKGEDFPSLPELTSDRGFEIDSSILKKMISKVIHSISDQDSKPMLRGAYFKINRDCFELISCDSYTLSICKMNCNINYIGEASGELSFIIPGHALNELVKVVGDDEKVQFFLARKHAIIRNGEDIFFTRTIDSEYIAYEQHGYG